MSRLIFVGVVSVKFNEVIEREDRQRDPHRRCRRSADFPAFWEAVIGGLLVASAVFLHATNWELVREIDLFALALAAQSLPFLASVALAVLLQPVRVNQRMLRRRNDLDVFKTGSLHAVGDELRGAPHVRDMFGQRADAGDTQESFQLVEKTRLILFYEEIGGLGHTLL